MKRNLANKDIREYARKKEVRNWEIAEIMGISEGHFCRKMRFEFDEADKEIIKAIIDGIADTRTSEKQITITIKGGKVVKQ